MFRTRFSLGDAAVIGICLLLTLLLLLVPTLQREKAAALLITTPDGSSRHSLSQSATLTLEGNGHSLTVVIENGSARVVTCDCPDGICKSSGAISSVGQSLLCAPAGIRLLIVDEEGGASDVDFIAG